MRDKPIRKTSIIQRSQFIQPILTSHTPSGYPREKDEVIGMWYLDKYNLKREKKPLFKQDFVVNIKKKDKEFISFSANQKRGKYVEPIKEFFKLYGSNGKFYHKGKRWQHHYDDLSDLPHPDLKSNAKLALKDEKKRLSKRLST